MTRLAEIIILVAFALIPCTIAETGAELKQAVIKAYCKRHPEAPICTKLAASIQAIPVVDEEVTRYCRALSMSYHVRCLHDFEKTAAKIPLSRAKRFKRAADAAAVSKKDEGDEMHESGFTKKQLRSICFGYREIYKTNCSVNADEPGKMKKYCDMYRKWCTKYDLEYEKEQNLLSEQQKLFGAEHPAYPAWMATAMAKRWPKGHFCHEYPRTCPKNLRGAEIMSLCQTFKFTEGQLCNNYERPEIRIGCNRFRKHCMKNAPPYTNYDDAEL